MYIYFDLRAVDKCVCVYTHIHTYKTYGFEITLQRLGERSERERVERNMESES